MEIEIVTKDDLEEFRRKLLVDLAEMIRSTKNIEEKEYLRTREVRKLLGGISHGTLLNLRVKRLLNPTKIEGVYYYKLAEVKKLLSDGTGT